MSWGLIECGVSKTGNRYISDTAGASCVLFSSLKEKSMNILRSSQALLLAIQAYSSPTLKKLPLKNTLADRDNLECGKTWYFKFLPDVDKHVQLKQNFYCMEGSNVLR